MQKERVGRAWLVTLVLMVLGTASGAGAQAPPTPRDEDKLTDATLERARTSPGLQLNAAYPLLPADDGPRHPRRGQRLVRTGGSLLGLGLLGIIMGATISSSNYEPCDEEEFCIDFGPSFGAIASAAMMAPLLLVGLITVGRGARLRARERRLSAGVQLGGGRYGVSLMGRF